MSARENTALGIDQHVIGVSFVFERVGHVTISFAEDGVMDRSH